MARARTDSRMQVTLVSRVIMFVSLTLGEGREVHGQVRVPLFRSTMTSKTLSGSHIIKTYSEYDVL